MFWFAFKFHGSFIIGGLLLSSNKNNSQEVGLSDERPGASLVQNQVVLPGRVLAPTTTNPQSRLREFTNASQEEDITLEQDMVDED